MFSTAFVNCKCNRQTGWYPIYGKELVRHQSFKVAINKSANRLGGTFWSSQISRILFQILGLRWFGGVLLRRMLTFSSPRDPCASGAGVVSPSNMVALAAPKCDRGKLMETDPEKSRTTIEPCRCSPVSSMKPMCRKYSTEHRGDVHSPLDCHDILPVSFSPTSLTSKSILVSNHGGPFWKLHRPMVQRAELPITTKTTSNLMITDDSLMTIS